MDKRIKQLWDEFDINHLTFTREELITYFYEQGKLDAYPAIRRENSVLRLANMALRKQLRKIKAVLGV